MNHIVKSIVAGLLVASLFTSGTAMAANDSNEIIAGKNIEAKEKASFEFKIIKRKNTESVMLYLQKQEGKKISIQLLAPNGIVLEKFTTSKKETNVNRFYNFTNAEAGVYTFEVTDGTNKITKKVTLENYLTEATTEVVLR